MAGEDEVVARKSKKRKERNNDMLAIHIVKDVRVEGDKSSEEENLMKKKSDYEGVERMKKKRKSAGDNKGGALMEDSNGITVEKAKKRKSEGKVEKVKRKKKKGEDNISRNQVKDSCKDPKLKNSKKKVRFPMSRRYFPSLMFLRVGMIKMKKWS
nr:cyclin-D-binding Myb-like transcription factor 1 [Ipomoea batatas]